MKTGKTTLRSVKKFIKWFRGLRLTDRCLLVFMALLLGQTAFTLFLPQTATPESVNLDVVMRTTAAAIFGYFMSANFLRDKPKKYGQDAPRIVEIPAAEPEGPRAETGFAVQGEQAHALKRPEETQVAQAGPERTELPHQQMIIVTVIGAVSLLLLLILRNTGGMQNRMIAPAAQLRDFVSGGVGFLIGHAGDDKRWDA